jgi:triphosphoribosyl-dephospho-CoA synthase
MGQVAEDDVAGQPTQTLREVMRPAVTRDFIAREYVQGFSFLARQAVPWFREAATRDDEAERSALWGPGGHPAVPAWEFAIVRTHVLLMANGCETLIRRKCGEGVYFDAMSRAAQIRDAGGLLSPASVAAFADFDRWLRADGHRRNPGTTADLIAGVLFWAIRERLWTPPSKAEVLVHGRAIAAGEMGPDG